MSYSLHIKNGDLDLSGPSGFAVVTGPQKLVQDLKNWILEARGTDSVHPDYGSVFDGDILPDGTVQESFIGSTIDSFQLLNIESEIRRILLAYQQQQLDRLRNETQAYQGKNTFSAGELLVSIDSVNIQQMGDVLVAQVSLTTDTGQQIAITQPVS